MDEPRVGTVLKVLCGSQAEELAGMVGISRVCSEQQGLHSNKDFAFHGKLWERIKNRRGYKKERKVQEDMKRQADRRRKESEDWKKGDRVLLSTKDLVFKEKPAGKLVD